MSDNIIGAPVAGDDILICALKVLQQPDPCLKAAFTEQAHDLWRTGSLSPVHCGINDGKAPPRPARDDARVRLVPPSELPRRGKGGSLASRQALLHSLVHIECCAIDLAWDIIARFGADPAYFKALDAEFYSDFLSVAADEARHFRKLLQRLNSLGMDYGAIPAHDGLWESAMATAHSLPARLAIEHCTHEARGLDVLPQTIGRFLAGGDEESASLLENVIYPEEISHCAAGVRWLRRLHRYAHNTVVSSEGDQDWIVDACAHDSVETWFHSLVRAHFHGLLKPPFNDAARARAGFGAEWYLPLSVQPCGGQESI